MPVMASSLAMKLVSRMSESVPSARAAARSAASYMPYNHVNDVVLPGGGGRSLPFFMYPQAQIDGVWLDSLAPQTVKYSIQAVTL